MAMTGASLKALMLRYRLQSEAAGVAVLAVVVSLFVGGAARRQLQPLQIEQNRLRGAQQEITAFRSSFKAATPEEEAFTFPDSLNVTVTRDVRFSLAQQVTLRAEQSGLRNVRVRFVSPDSSGAVAPVVPDLASGKVAVADYTITLDCHGAFGSALALVRHLPASVALQRISAARGRDGATEYHIVLAVFEAPAGAAHG